MDVVKTLTSLIAAQHLYSCTICHSRIVPADADYPTVKLLDRNLFLVLAAVALSSAAARVERR